MAQTLNMWFLLHLLALCASVLSFKRPNIVLVLTDDQDLILGGMTPMKQVQKLIANQGVTFTNAFVSTPICCPSRSSILTGRYLHNHQTVNNSADGGCSSRAWQQKQEPTTFGAQLKSAGYRTFYAGKYLNAYGYKAAGGVQHVPVGWDWWFGLKGNSRYYNYTISVNGTAKYFTNRYLTNLIQEYAVQFLDSVGSAAESFLMVLAPPAPHAPYTPEPKYQGKFKGAKVPRTPNFNTHRLKNRHWLLNMLPEPLGPKTVAQIDSYYASRWEALLSVDDMVAATVHKLQKIGQLDNTFIIYTSDHGYHLGHFGLPWDKRQPYEMDIRVPLLLRGPGIEPKTLDNSLVVNIDIAPTILDMAGLMPDLTMDGHSFLPNSYPSFRRAFLLEYVGEGDSRTVSSKCPLQNDNTLSECYPLSACKCQDARNNTYNCIRSLDNNVNTLFCEFYKEDHVEFFDISLDPYQLDNCLNKISSAEQERHHLLLDALQSCKGIYCQVS